MNAIIWVLRGFESFNREYGARLRIVQSSVYGSDTYYLFNKRVGAELQKTLDVALKELKDDGTMKKFPLKVAGWRLHRQVTEAFGDSLFISRVCGENPVASRRLAAVP